MYPDNGVLNHKERGSNGMDIDAIFCVNIGDSRAVVCKITED